MCLNTTRRDVLALVLCLVTSVSAQVQKAPNAKVESTEKVRTTREDDLVQQSVLLLLDLQTLDTQAIRFDDPLLKALAKAEIADGAWNLDRDWSKKLLREAYELTLPDADQQQKEQRAAGAAPIPPSGADRSRWKVRNRVLGIARRERDFVNELVNLERNETGAYGAHHASAVLADQALEEGDIKASADYILDAVKADPTQIAGPFVINELALKDRAAADHLILSYLEELRMFPLSSTNQSDFRTFYILGSLIKPYVISDSHLKVPQPGPEVMRAYISYMLDTLGALEQREPGSLQRWSKLLLSLWIPLQQYAPEMLNRFLSLVSISGGAGGDSSLPTAASMNEKRRNYEKKIKDAEDSDQPSDGALLSAINKGEYARVRKMLDKLPDGPRKDQLTDQTNAEESISTAAKGDIFGAESLAGRLKRATSILKVYPVLVGKCVTQKDHPCATRLVSQALKQVKTSNTAPPWLPGGIPASAVMPSQFFDPILSSIAKLSVAILPLDEELAFSVASELVAVANSIAAGKDQSSLGFDLSTFRKLASRNEDRAQEVAYIFKNPVQRVLALAAVDQWRAEELGRKRQRAPVGLNLKQSFPEQLWHG
jgi:hypothetical protein